MSNERITIVIFLLSGVVALKAVLCITIDNQLQVIRNDCYERLAIGQRLKEDDVYKESDLNTVTDCQMECTHDEEKCRSFSFGIGVKGNASCELSSYDIKETVDLKPIGTLDDPDFDLYVKKLGCKLVIDMQPNLPDFVNDDSPEMDDYNGDKARPQPRPSFYKKHHNMFQYGSEHHQSSHNSDSHWSMKKLYQSDQPLNSGDRAVSYNTYNRPETGFYNKLNDYGSPEHKPDPYKDADKFSISNPYDAFDPLNHNKPHDHYNTDSNKGKPSLSDYNNYKKPSNTGYDNKPFSSAITSSGYGSDHVQNRPSKPNYDSNPKPPFRPTHLSNPYDDKTDHLKPSRPQYIDPDNPNYESTKPISSSYGDNSEGYGSNNPYKPSHSHISEGYHYKKPSSYNTDSYNYNKPADLDNSNKYQYHKPEKPWYGESKPVFEMNNDESGYPSRPSSPIVLYGIGYEGIPNGPGKPYGGSHDALPDIYSPKYPHRNSLVKDTVDPYGRLVTSIITEIGNVCFRRALAGKRVSRIFVRKAVSCERVEDCQQECAEEKRFTCEGFNYRLDPSGHGRGDCELLDVPFIRLDLHRDIIPDPEYDYYEKDRNSYQNCKEHRPIFRPTGGDHPPGPPPPLHDWYSRDHFEHYNVQDKFRDRYDIHENFDHRETDRNLRPSLHDRFNERSRPSSRRNDYYEESYSSRNKYEDRFNRYDYGYHYLIPINSFEKNYDYKSYEPYPPSRDKYKIVNSWDQNKYYENSYYDKIAERPLPTNKWGSYGGNYGDFGRGYADYGHFENNYDFAGKKYQLNPPSITRHWGEYGGTYGTGSGYNSWTNDYWNLNKVIQDQFTGYGLQPPPGSPSTGYLPPLDNHDKGYKYDRPGLTTEDSIHSKTSPVNFINECSLRSATGYRLYKSVVKKILTVPTIYECEYACFKEKKFLCTSYAFRYIVGAGVPPNNCYLSDKSYKELNYYTDLEQDRNFDIYTMNNRDGCNGGLPHHRDSSECFLHVRSGQRFDDRCVKDSFIVKSIVDCELACLKSSRFICRTFSFRYGSPLIGSVRDNCQLTDIPYHELDFQRDLTFDPGFVIYERASFGYGCEINHLPGVQKPKPSSVSLADDLCYIGFGWPAKLLPQAVKKVLKVDTESECKAECTRFRMKTPLCCMSFSYKSTVVKNEPNCFLSDIFQRDLLENIDYIRDADYWLFSWDNTNPQCHFPDYYEQRVPFGDRNDILPGLLTWRIYSVGGWPCKRGSLCRQSELGFWFCELEGGSPSAWDYCCRPRHQCGYSEGFPYQWCYVGPSSTQWRKCNDRYYPYLPSLHPTDYIPIHPPKPASIRPPDYYIPIQPSKPTTFLPHIPEISSKPPITDYDTKPPLYVPNPPSSHIEPPKRTYLPPSVTKPRPWVTTGKPLQSDLQPPYRPGFRPDRPPASPPVYKPTPSLSEYEEEFDNFFLDPPKPGGFGQPRHWPVSYLHKEMPPDATVPLEQKFEQMKIKEEIKVKPGFQAIQNLIEVIKTNDLDNIKYQITNASDRADDILHVQIPLPNKFSDNLTEKKTSDKPLISNPIDLLPPKRNSANVTDVITTNDNINQNTASVNAKEKHNLSRRTSLYRRGFIEKTNATHYGRSIK